jgi:hypothetical protein
MQQVDMDFLSLDSHDHCPDQGGTATTSPTEPPVSRWVNHPGPDLEAKDTRPSTEKKPARYAIRMAGEWVSLAEAARRRDRPYKVILERYKRGQRGAELFRPVETRREDPVFHVGLCESDWLIIIDYAKAHGVDEAADRFDVPVEATQAAVNGEMERLD